MFEFQSVISSAGLVGDVSAAIRWGDGTETPASVSGGNTSGNVRIRFDYSLDSRNFFGNPARRALLQLAADTIVGRFGDTLAAITPAGKATWQPQVFHPSLGPQPTFINLSPNLTIAANEIVVYAGATDLPAGIRGLGAAGAIQFPSVSGTPEEIARVRAFRDVARGRGERGALGNAPTDVAPWGGSISFDAQSNWYFGNSTDAIRSDQIDFLTIAVHELAHLLGFGYERVSAETSWTRLTTPSGFFVGPAAVAGYRGSGPVPLAGEHHWAQSVVDVVGQPTAMTAVLPVGSRSYFSTLDFAAMQDIGWEVLDTRTTVSAAHRYPDNGTFPISVVLRGSRSGEISHPVSQALVTNVAPEITLPNTLTAVAGQPLTIADLATIVDPGFANSAVDPATAETFEYRITWGDGTAQDRGVAQIDVVGDRLGGLTQASFDGSHTFALPGTYTVVVRVADDDGAAVQDTFTVVVEAPPILQLSLSADRIAEDDGDAAAMLTVSRSGPDTNPLTVSLSSSDTSEATVPNRVVIPAGQSSTSVPVQAVDDTLLDGDVSIELSASASGFEADAVDLIVQDREFLDGFFTAEAIVENEPDSVSLVLRRSDLGDTSSPVEVQVSGPDRAKLGLPALLTIPAARNDVLIPLRPSDNDTPQRDQQIELGFAADGFRSLALSIELQDDELPLFQNSDDPFDVDRNGQATARDALLIVNEIAVRNGVFELDPSSELPAGKYVDTNGDYRVTALDALLVINELRRLRAAAESVGWLAVEEIDGFADDDDDPPWLALRVGPPNF